MMYNEELYHHGIKGQRWGVRRFQNPDGSLTEVGKRREARDRTISKKLYKISDKDYDEAMKTVKKISPERQKSINRKVRIGMAALGAVSAGVIATSIISAKKSKNYDEGKAFMDALLYNYNTNKDLKYGFGAMVLEQL